MFEADRAEPALDRDAEPTGVHRFLNREYLDRAHAFFERYGGKAIVIGSTGFSAEETDAVRSAARSITGMRNRSTIQPMRSKPSVKNHIVPDTGFP